MPAPLEQFLRLISSGNTTLSPELYAAFGGESILKELQKFDPNAAFSDVAGNASGGEAGGGGPTEKRLDFDVTKLPKTKAGEFWEIGNSDKRALVNPNRVVNDENYGSVTNSANYQKQQDPLWVKLAPLLVTLAAPMAGGALASAGIGAAGGTAGVTGGIAGLGAGNIASGGTSALGTALKNLPSMARQIDQSGGNMDLMQILSLIAGPGAGATGINPTAVKGALTLAQLARQGKR